ncbi:beta-ketoacyl-[acyl-carrier-protein] synthase family protein [Actinocorallia lasiicapitis]
MRRVAVTGVGVVSALGSTTEQSWKGMLAGHTAIRPIRGFDASALRTRLAAEIDDFDLALLPDSCRRTARKMMRGERYAVSATALALRDAGLEDSLDAERTALFTGSSKEVSDLTKLTSAIVEATGEDGRFDVRKVGENVSSFQPLFYVEGLQGASLFYISAAFSLMGANTYFAGTAEAGLNAVGRAFRSIRRGESDVAIAGGYDDPTWWWGISSFDSLGVLTGSDDPAAFRPFDRAADGAVLGEGAAFLILEEWDSARARGAHIHAEVTGYGCGNDAHQLLTPHPEGRGLVHALNRALEDARTDTGEVSYIAAHGSATKLGDLSEAAAYHRVFGPHTPAASSVKPSVGHTVGASGAMNVAVAVLAASHGAVPPNLNLSEPRPGCAFDWVTGSAREMPVATALAVARGLEGQNTVLAVRSVQGRSTP